jgi:hypothetical protein
MRSGRVGTTIPDYLPKGGFARGSLEKEDGNANSKKRDLPRRHGGHGEKRGGERRREEERNHERHDIHEKCLRGSILFSQRCRTRLKTGPKVLNRVCEPGFETGSSTIVSGLGTKGDEDHVC